MLQMLKLYNKGAWWKICTNKFNLDEMDQYFEIHKIPKLTQEEI